MKNNKQIKQNKQDINFSRKGRRGLKELEDALDPLVLAKQILIKGENKGIFINYVLKIIEEVPVYFKTEEEFLKKYIFSSWKLGRMREIEKNLLNKQQTESKGYDFSSSSDGKKKRIRNLSKIEIDDDLNRIFLLQSSLEKQMVKALKQLREEQSFNLLKRKVN